MRLHRSLGSAIVGAAILLGASSAFAHEAPKFTRMRIAQPTDTLGKIEVIEFFWYGCPHCSIREHRMPQLLSKHPNWAAAAKYGGYYVAD